MSCVNGKAVWKGKKRCVRPCRVEHGSTAAIEDQAGRKRSRRGRELTRVVDAKYTGRHKMTDVARVSVAVRGREGDGCLLCFGSGYQKKRDVMHTKRGECRSGGGGKCEMRNDAREREKRED